MEAPQGGFFLSEQKISFKKPPLSLDEQVKLLVGRGLVVDDYDSAKHYLSFIGYYRLSGYTRYFTDPTDEKHEAFLKDISFQRVLNLYIFDRKLRALLMDSFERIEIALKAVVSHEGSILKGAFWLNEPSNFDHGQHEAVLSDVDEAIGSPGDGKTQHLFIAHFREKYSDVRPPSWMVFETMSFGAVSRTFQGCKGEIQTAIAKPFDVNRSVLESWMHVLAFGRNVCAHNCRIWNRTFTIKQRHSLVASADPRLAFITISPASTSKPTLRRVLGARICVASRTVFSLPCS